MRLECYVFQISVVPNGVDGLHLTELNLNQNQISSLSASLAECPRLKTLRLEENCLGLDALPSDLVNKFGHLVGWFPDQIW